jgi:sialic acid synthase SpsE/mannose-6-phosphate isomerase-like protein (cupin superfamily)
VSSKGENVMTINSKPLFIFEMANNHMGDVSHGLKIINEIYNVTKEFDFSFAFKLQYRHLDTFIHPDYKGRQDIKYIKRFSETRLSKDDFRKLKDSIKTSGFLAMCTAFDEPSVDLIEEHGFDIIKIGSCSFTDWPLLERIAKTNLPIIASNAGVSLEDTDKVISYFEHRNKNISLMHCVAEYPTRSENLQMNQIDLLKKRYPQIKVGFSTHESPDNMDPIKIAIAKGASIFEKHVGVKTENYALNAYSADPAQVYNCLLTAKETYKVCGVANERYEFTEKELCDLRGLRRGVFAKEDLKAGETLDPSKIFLAIPIQDNQISANDLSKYTRFSLLHDVKKNQPVLFSDANTEELREKVLKIVKDISSYIISNRVQVPNKLDFEISHHYGIDKFDQIGCTIITFINREYCKKVIILLPNQTHPEQYHNQKEESFYIMNGSMELTLNGVTKKYTAGDIVVVERGMKHKMYTETGVAFEEISSTHYKDDSFYTDDEITNNKNRKTNITYWIN